MQGTNRIPHLRATQHVHAPPPMRFPLIGGWRLFHLQPRHQTGSAFYPTEAGHVPHRDHFRLSANAFTLALYSTYAVGRSTCQDSAGSNWRLTSHLCSRLVMQNTACNG